MVDHTISSLALGIFSRTQHHPRVAKEAFLMLAGSCKSYKTVYLNREFQEQMDMILMSAFLQFLL